MADEQEETFFQPEEVKEIIKVEVRQVLPDDVEYNPEKVEGWIAQIQERVMKRLIVDKKPFKYICTCVIQQRNGAGLHCANGMYWENDDGTRLRRHECRYAFNGRRRPSLPPAPDRSLSSPTYHTCSPHHSSLPRPPFVHFLGGAQDKYETKSLACFTTVFGFLF